MPVARNAFLAALAGNKAYLNIHTTAFPGGEIRGFFMQQVPGPLPVLGIGAALAWSRRLRRRLAANAT
ncbi:MAG: CHRD domain-containing protein [Cyanobacteria bacterium]|nr:CHRD domain-containing protein [Cyanobacteriota bacterium]